ncbi:MAG: LemA family protein [Acidobacteriota bacterium]
MQKSYFALGCGFVVIVGLLIGLIIAGSVWSARGNLVEKQQAVKSAWGQVENVYQRRMDLIPNLVEVVKRYAAHESTVFTQVAEARAGAGRIQISPEALGNPELLAQYQKAQGELSSALTRLLAVSESYPELKANENFRDLQVQLEGTENRIAVERMRYNEVVQAYNTYRNKSMFAMLAGAIFGYDREKAYFKADEGAQKAPDVGKIFDD